MLPARGVSKSKVSYRWQAHAIALLVSFVLVCRAYERDTSEVAGTNRDSNREISSSIPKSSGGERGDEGGDFIPAFACGHPAY